MRFYADRRITVRQDIHKGALSMKELDTNQLAGLTNDRVLFQTENGTLLVRSIPYRYADFVRIDDIESIILEGRTLMISMKTPTSMGDMRISIDLETGIATADDKRFDEPMPDFNRPKKKRIKPSINGFSIKNVRMIPSEDGYACSCQVMFNGEVVGDFLDKGDGSEYSFWADPPFSTSKIEAVIHSFPPTVRDYGLGPIPIEYDMCQMVNDLLEMADVAKELAKLKEWQDYVLIDDWIHGKHFTMKPQKSMTDEELETTIRKQMEAQGLNIFELRRFSSEDSLSRLDSFVVAEALKNS